MIAGIGNCLLPPFGSYEVALKGLLTYVVEVTIIVRLHFSSNRIIVTHKRNGR